VVIFFSCGGVFTGLAFYLIHILLWLASPITTFLVYTIQKLNPWITNILIIAAIIIASPHTSTQKQKDLIDIPTHNRNR
jgi:cytochrome b subunit of formate dehydrogenase